MLIYYERKLKHTMFSEEGFIFKRDFFLKDQLEN